jgi:NADP-dependent 3-hydroxy acid dehydrogenase YdfG
MSDFTEQVAVVTGANSGIGAAIALGLAAQGATLCLVGRNSERLEAVAEAARMATTQVLCHQADLTLDKDIAELSTRLESDYGRVDVLVHSAGVITLGMLESARIDDLDRQYRINVHAPYVLTQALLPMLKRRHGQIVFINSSAGLSAGPSLGQYAATKHALKAISDSLRGEVNAQGVRVLSVYPGRTATPMQATVHEMEGKTYHPKHLLQPEDVASIVIHVLSLPRTAEVTDISIRPMMKS